MKNQNMLLIRYYIQGADSTGGRGGRSVSRWGSAKEATGETRSLEGGPRLQRRIVVVRGKTGQTGEMSQDEYKGATILCLGLRSHLNAKGEKNNRRKRGIKRGLWTGWQGGVYYSQGLEEKRGMIEKKKKDPCYRKTQIGAIQWNQVRLFKKSLNAGGRDRFDIEKGGKVNLCEESEKGRERVDWDEMTSHDE